ncbi:glypican-4 [Phymastichus coffea]|uniref:glypican-4 n=1 Tax=Phymastichus coffea TaxID=108790 RepID=UPI00273C354B|nr:glypican-4 [Phymastichus coffea]XP_058798358.1 glypican-4 [Phymastichus coffea]
MQWLRSIMEKVWWIILILSVLITVSCMRTNIVATALPAASISSTSTQLQQTFKPQPHLQRLHCQAIHTYFESLGFPTSNLPREPISSRELKICTDISSGGEVCCSTDMELKMQIKARDRHDKTTKNALHRLQNVLQTRAHRFHDFFNDLLNASKRSFHEMFKKTYGILYEQNAYVFIDLFRELEKYYAKGSVDLDNVMDTFFNTLYQKMFTVLNSQYKFDNKYLECVSHHMKEMRPFGDVPQKLSVQIKRSFVATRAFSQALQIGADVLKNMQQLKSSSDCTVAITRMSVCPKCAGFEPEKALACNDMCENVMKGCLIQHTALDTEWNHFVDAVDKVADRLLGPFNIEMLVRPINLKISEAIMNFQESSSDVSQRVFTGCGRPVLGRRRRRRRRRAEPGRRSDHIGDDGREEEGESDNENQYEDDVIDEKEIGISAKLKEEDELAETSSVFLDKLVKEIKQRVRDSRQFWIYLPYKLCNDEGLAASPSRSHDCWNGTHLDKYTYPITPQGLESQHLNPEVRTSGQAASASTLGSSISDTLNYGHTVNAVREQIFALSSISNRLRLAFNGHDVDWTDVEDSWSNSGSGSGISPVDPITDDEDGFDEGSESESPLDRSHDKSDDHNQKQDVSHDEFKTSRPASDLPGQQTSLPGQFPSSRQTNMTENDSTASVSSMSLGRALTTYLLPIVVMWFGSCFVEWL